MDDRRLSPKVVLRKLYIFLRVILFFLSSFPALRITQRSMEEGGRATVQLEAGNSSLQQQRRQPTQIPTVSSPAEVTSALSSCSLAADHPVVAFLSREMLQGYADEIVSVHRFTTVEMLVEHIQTEADVNLLLGIRPLAHVKLLLAALARERRRCNAAARPQASRRPTKAQSTAATTAGGAELLRPTVVLPASRFLRSCDFLPPEPIRAATAADNGSPNLESSVCATPCPSHPVPFSQSMAPVELVLHADTTESSCGASGDHLIDHHEISVEESYRLAAARTLRACADRMEGLKEELVRTATSLVEGFDERLACIGRDRDESLAALAERAVRDAAVASGSEEKAKRLIEQVAASMPCGMLLGFSARLEIALALSKDAPEVCDDGVSADVPSDPAVAPERCDRGTSPGLVGPIDSVPSVVEDDSVLSVVEDGTSGVMIITVSSRSATPANGEQLSQTQATEKATQRLDPSRCADMSFSSVSSVSRASSWDEDETGALKQGEGSPIQANDGKVHRYDDGGGFEDGPSGLELPEALFTQNSFGSIAPSHTTLYSDLDDRSNSCGAGAAAGTGACGRSPSLICSRDPFSRPPLRPVAAVGASTIRPVPASPRGHRLQLTHAEIDLASREELLTLCRQFGLATRPLNTKRDEIVDCDDIDDDDDDEWFAEMMHDGSDTEARSGPSSPAPLRRHVSPAEISQASAASSNTSCRVAPLVSRSQFLRNQLRGLLARSEFSLKTVPSLLRRVPAFSGLAYNKRLRSESRLQRDVEEALTKDELDESRKRLRSEERVENFACIVASLAHDDFVNDKCGDLVQNKGTYAAVHAQSGRVAAFCQHLEASGGPALPTTLFEAAVLREAVDLEAAAKCVKKDFPHVSSSAIEALLQVSGVPVTLPKSSARAQAAGNWYRSKHKRYKGGQPH
jgi:hypothetical protein